MSLKKADSVSQELVTFASSWRGKSVIITVFTSPPQASSGQAKFQHVSRAVTVTEFICAATLSCLKNKVEWKSSSTSGSYNFLPPLPWGSYAMKGRGVIKPSPLEPFSRHVEWSRSPSVTSRGCSGVRLESFWPRVCTPISSLFGRLAGIWMCSHSRNRGWEQLWILISPLSSWIVLFSLSI